MFVFLDIDSESVVNGWGSSSISEASIELEIADNHDFFQSPPRSYRLDNGVLIKRTQEEIQSEYVPQQPSEMELLRAELEKVKDEKKQSDLAILELSQMMLGG